ncbi:MAG: hypothetical protein AB7S78_09300 [Candidatus Omnitrophota bacterium]
MNTKLNILLALFAGSLFLSPTLAVSEEEAMVEAAAESTTATVSGSIVSVNVAEQYVVLDSGVEGEDGTTETAIYYFTETVNIMKGGAAVTAADLMEGDNVSAEYSTDEDDNKIISSITVL